MNILSQKSKVDQLLGSIDAQQVLKAMAKAAVEAAVAGSAAGKGAEKLTGDGDGSLRDRAARAIDGDKDVTTRLREGAARVVEGDGDVTTRLREGAAKLLDADDGGRKHHGGRLRGKLNAGIAAAGAAVAVTAASAALSAARKRSGAS